MKISSAAIKDGNFEDKYGAKGTDFANKLSSDYDLHLIIYQINLPASWLQQEVYRP